MKHENDLYETIRHYGENHIPMHMPGHKRNMHLWGEEYNSVPLPYDGDITEINGFDNLHDLEEGGILCRIADRAASLYRAKRAFPLVNGSTGGILAAIRALTAPAEKILVARNSHKSVYHAIELCMPEPVYLFPAVIEDAGILGSIRPEDVERAFQNDPDIRTVVITSPTYEGVISNIPAIAEITHRHGARLLVDAAHGAHLGFHPDFPDFPRDADIVITSLHKTLPSLTQTSLALVFSEDEALAARLQREIAVFETSSPSYVLLASIDRCLALLEHKKAALFSAYRDHLSAFYEQLRSLHTLSLFSPKRGTEACFDFDPGKLVFLVLPATFTGPELADRLRCDYHIEVEMTYTHYALCMTSIADPASAFSALASAVCNIDQTLPSRKSGETFPLPMLQSAPNRILPVSKAILLPQRPLTIGDPSTVYLWVYPPGIPFLVPGEEVTGEHLREIARLQNAGLSVKIRK